MPTVPPGASVDSPKAISAPPSIEIRSLAPGDDATAFRTLNEEWITRYFTLEAKDRETLNDPVRSILLKGGHIFMAYAAADAVACVALIPMQDGVYELFESIDPPAVHSICRKWSLNWSPGIYPNRVWHSPIPSVWKRPARR